MKFGRSRAGKNDPSEILENHLTFVVVQECRQHFAVEHLRFYLCRHRILPRSRAARQFTKYLVQALTPQMEVYRWQQQWFERFPTLDSSLKRTDKVTVVDIHPSANCVFTCFALVAPLIAEVIERRKAAQRHGEDKEIERSEERFVVLRWDVEKGYSSWANCLVVTSVFQASNCELCPRRKQGLYRPPRVQQAVVAPRRCCYDFGVSSRNALKKCFDKRVKWMWKASEQKEVDGSGGRQCRRQLPLL
jgi:hypothetical protein